MRIVIIQNGNRVVARAATAAEARARVLALIEKSPAATFEAALVTRRVYSEVTPASRRVIEEDNPQ